jgi:tetratricopeptide (TPR) repeat protein
MRWFWRTLWVGLSGLGLAHGLLAQGEVTVEGAPPPWLGGQVVPAVSGPILLDRAAAERALELGFPAEAATLWARAAATPGLAVEEGRRLRLAWATALIEARRLPEARAVLAGMPEGAEARVRLREGLIALAEGDFVAARGILEEVAPGEVPGEERAWWHYAQGILADEAGEVAAASEAFNAAAAAAGSRLQRARFELADLQARLRRSAVTEAQVATLRQNVDRFQGRGVGYDFAKQYAAALGAMGREAEAAAFLQNQLQTLPAAETAMADDFRLLLGLLAGPGEAVGSNALGTLLRTGRDAGKQRMALQLLARAAGDGLGRARLRRELGGLLMATGELAIEEDVRLTRAQLALVDNDYDAAESDARTVLERFPGSELRAAALGVLVSVDWERGRYRAAAANAAAAREALGPGRARAEFGVLLAEAFFRAGDFRSAAAAYEAALAEVPESVAAGRLMYQQVGAEIAGGRLTEAGGRIDGWVGDARFDAVSRWQAEWNLARALQAAERGDEALARVDRLMAARAQAAREDELPGALEVQLAWLQARLALSRGQAQRALELVGVLRGRLTVEGEGVAGASGEVASSLALLEAEANFALEAPEAALAGLRRLREEFPRSDAAVYSFIVEADAYGARNQLVEAQQLLTRLADDFPEHRYAPFALVEAAIYAERRGQEVFYQEAYNILERLVRRYPRSELLFQARLMQGDLLRQLNQFAAAQQTYEWLINNLGQHAGVWRAQLALADCHAAQAASDASHQESANAIYERLLDLPTAATPLRIEAGFKLGYALVRRGGEATERGRAVWWQVVTTFLVDRGPGADLGSRGRYWLSRVLLEVGASWEQAGDPRRAQNAYRLLIASGLPGEALARSRLARAGGGAVVDGGE